MSYPSIISQPGSADRNFAPILEAIRPWVLQSASESGPSSSTSTVDTINGDGVRDRAKASILEIGSFPYAHIRGFAREFTDVEWYGSGRDDWEVEEINKGLATQDLGNLHSPLRLDISNTTDWEALRSQHGHALQPFKGVVMLNVVHCCPEGTPENVFRELAFPDEESTPSRSDRLLDKGGWVAVYGPYLADDGSYKSKGDEEFDHTYIKAQDSRLGLRTIGSISRLAEKWGFEEVERREMPKGNMWVVWRLVRVRG